MGYLLILINALIYGTGTVLKKKFSEDTKGIPVALDIYLFFMCPMALLFYFITAKGQVPLNLPTLIFSVIFAAISLSSMWFGMTAYRFTSLVYITVFNGAGGTIVPFFFELFFLHEQFGVWKVLSVILRLIAICVPLLLVKQKENRMTHTEILVCLVLFLNSGASSVVSKLYGIYPGVASDNSFCFWTNAVIIPFILIKVLRKIGLKTILQESRKIKGIDYLCVVVSMLIGNVGTLLMLQALRLISATVYSVLNTSLSMMVMALLSVFFYHEKLTKEAAVSLIFSLAAIVCGVL